MPINNTMCHRTVLPQTEPDAITSVIKFTYRQKGISPKIKSAEELAVIYQEKFKDNENINSKMITIRLIERFRNRYIELLERFKDIEDQDIVQINKYEIKKFENGELDSEIFASVARHVGREIRNNFAKRLGTKIWNQITKNIS